MKEDIILIGGGGHCKSVIDVIEQEGKYNIIGIVDTKENVGKKVLDYKIIGCDNDLPSIFRYCKNALITIGHLKSNERRKTLFNRLKDIGYFLPTIISPLSHVSKYSEVKEGSVIMNYALINSGAYIGKNCIINNKALVEHDAIVGNNTHISTGTIINGDCKIGSNCMVGSNSTIKQGIKICDDVIIGSGSVVIKDINEPGVYAGIPARKIS
jgi:sugar O-acyltransferase (sialic acid O-acetyltransferase NeuD family)